MTNWALRKHPRFAGVKGPVVVCVMDGVGIGQHDEGDAVWLARTPNLDWLATLPATTRLTAHGTAVGMPSDADMGNSEVGHNALGAGRVFDQGAKLVDNAIKSGSLFAGDTWREIVARSAAHKGSTLHFVGLLSDGNVHSHIAHLLAMLARASEEGVERVRVHVLLDGRDVSATSAPTYVAQLEQRLSEINRASGRDYRIASGGGRQTTTMDRYGADYRIVERGWKAHVLGDARAFASTLAAIETLRAEQPGVIDQDLPPFVIADESGPVGCVQDGDSVVFFNFRGDRAIELSQAFEQDDFKEFDRVRRPDVLFAGMMEYDGDLHVPKRYLVSPPAIDRTLGEYLARNRVTQLAVSETQKFGHVTYFWNGNRSGMFDEQYEKYIEVPSDRISFDLKPWMKAAEITDAVIAELRTGKMRHARLNYANGDMVGHTGHRDAAVLAVQTVDLMLGRLLPVIAELEGAILVTADHGNADEMFEVDKKAKSFAKDAHGSPKAKTSHTLNPVPLHVYAPGHELAIDTRVAVPKLSNIAATTLQLLGYEAPEGFDSGLLKL